MKYANFVMKLLCMAAVLGTLWQYQRIAESRAALVTEHEAQIAEINAYNETVLQAMEEIPESDSSREEPTQEAYIYADGVYEGTAAGFGGDITVSVTIEADEITQIEVLSAEGEDPAYYEQAETVLDDILTTQSTDVDTISGATFSSAGLIAATRQAMEKAVK